MADRILLRAIEFYGYHGVTPEEQRLGHRYSADVALELDLTPAGQADDLARTVNYEEVCQRVVQIGAGCPVRLMETLAGRIAGACLEAYPQIEAVQVTLRKLLPPVPSVVASAEVVIRRERDERSRSERDARTT